MSKPNLIEIIRRDRERIKELENLIPLMQNSLNHTAKENPFYRAYEVKLDQLMLEYKERVGYGFTGDKED